MAMTTMTISNAVRKLALGSTVGLGGLGVYRYRNVIQRERSDLPTDPLVVFKKNHHHGDNSNNNNNNDKKRVIIIGAGVVGVATAYKLAKLGHEVAIVEPMPRPAEECSHCAAGGMQVSNPVVDKDSWKAVLECIVPFQWSKNRQPFKFFQIDWWQTLSDPFFLRWVMTFTKTSLFPDQQQHDKQNEMLKFTKYAVDDMVNMMGIIQKDKKTMADESGFNTNGSLAVSYDPPVPSTVSDEKNKEEGDDDEVKSTTSSSNVLSTSAATAAVKSSKNFTASKMSYEPHEQLVGTEAVLEVEPSLRFQKVPPTSAKFEYDAKSASSGRFSKELARWCEEDDDLQVNFLYNTKVEAISTTTVTTDDDINVVNKKSNKPRISKLHTNRGIVDVPEDVQVVVAAGSWTPRILSLMDLYVPVYPLKGYAMSVSAKEILQQQQHPLQPQDLPSRIVCDKYMFTTRLGDEIRVTSIGEFSGWNTAPTAHVDAEFRREADRQFPQLAPWTAKAETRCGHRPFVNDGILLLGKADTHENLFVTCGPGSNGWKLAMGSGEVIARLVSGESTEQIANELDFDPSAFSPAGRVLNAPFFAKLCRARWNV